MTLIRSTGLTTFIYGGNQPLRLVGTPQSGETDGRSTFTSVNTSRIFTRATDGRMLTFTPGNPFSGFDRLLPGQSYSAQGKVAFDFSAGFPLTNAAAQSQALAVIQTAVAQASGLPIAAINVTPTSGDTSTAFSFNATGSTPGTGEFILGYEWDFGDGSPIAFSNAPTHTYATAGTYPVQLRVMNNNNVRSNWATRAIGVTAVGGGSGEYAIGLNLSSFADWDAGVTTDRFHNARKPISITDNQFGQGVLDVDSLGFVRSLAANQRWTAPIAIENARENMPVGTYIFKWTGDRQKSTIALRGGTLTYTTPVTATEHRATFQWGGTQDIWIDGSNYASDIGGNYPRSFKLLLPGYENSTEIFNPVFLKRCTWRKGGLRFMDWQRTNINEFEGAGNVTTEWSQRTTLASYSQCMRSGASIELAVRLCNEVQCPGYFCVPTKYSNTSIQLMLEYLRDNLDPDLNMIVEWSNEAWQNGNPAFQQGAYARDQGRALNLVPATEPDWISQWSYSGYQTANISKIADTVFAGQRDRIKVVINGQASFGNAFQCRTALNLIHPTYGVKCGSLIDGIFIAPYFAGPATRAENYAATQSKTLDQLFADIKTHIDTDIVSWVETHLDLKAEFPNMTIFGNYEGLQHFDVSAATSTEMREFFASKFYEMNLAPQMYSTVIYYYQKLFELMGNDSPCFAFSDAQRWGRSDGTTPQSYWGVSRSLVENLDVAVKRKALHVLNGDDLSQITNVSY